MKIAEKYNVAIYITNQVMSKPDVFFGDPTEAIGGHIVSHNSTYRVYLRRGKKSPYTASIVFKTSDQVNFNQKVINFLTTKLGWEKIQLRR